MKAEAHAYIDDTAGAALPDAAQVHYSSILDTMETIGLDHAPDKCQPPATTLTWVSVFLDSIAMTMSIDKDRVLEALHLCENFLAQHSVSLKYMQRFVGKVMHVIKCTDSARRFVSRILELLTTSREGCLTPISPRAQADARRLLHFLLTFNGVTMMKPTVAQFVVEVDACLKGMGAWCAGLGYYNAPFPSSILACNFSIAGLECYNVLLALRIWHRFWKGKTVLVFSDNAGTVCSVNSGRAHDPLMQGVLCELTMADMCHLRYRSGCTTQARG